MAAPNQSAASLGNQYTVYNGTGTDIPDGTALAIDNTVTIGASQALAVKATTGHADVIGFAYGMIANGKNGTCNLVGFTCRAIAGTTFASAGSYLMTNNAGSVILQTAGSYGCGINLTTCAAAGEKIVIMRTHAKNA